MKKHTVTEPAQVQALARKLERLLEELAELQRENFQPWKRQQIIREEINVIKRRIHELDPHYFPRVNGRTYDR